MCRISVGRSNHVEVATPYLANLLIDTSLSMSDKLNKDGFGIFLANDNEPAMYKKAKPCSEIVVTQDFNQWLWANNKGFGPVICHVRQATTGKGLMYNDNYAHPFLHEGLALVHNGHLFNAESVRNEQNLSQDLSVDSEIFLHALHKFSGGGNLTQEVIQNTVNQFIGPFVFVVYEYNTQLTWIITGKSRTLHFYKSPDFSVILTEAGYSNYLTRSLNRYGFLEGFKYSSFEAGVKLPDDHIFVFNDDGLNEVGTITSKEDYPKVLKAPVVTKPVTARHADTDGFVSDTIRLTDIRENISVRNGILRKYNMNLGDLKLLLEELSIVFSDNCYSITTEQWKIIDEFLGTLPIDPKDYTKHSIWWDIKQACGRVTGDDSEEATYTLLCSWNIEFIKPYMLNSKQVLIDLLERLKSTKEIVEVVS